MPYPGTEANLVGGSNPNEGELVVKNPGVLLGYHNAFVVLRRGARATEEDLKQVALANGPAYQHPRRVFFLQQLPLAGTNKIDKERLRKWAAKGSFPETSDER